MNLLVFATEMERDGVFPNGTPKGYRCLISGVGVLSTAISLCKAFQSNRYENAIQIGIAGAYRSSGLKIGEAVEVKSDCLVEFLPWEPNTFFASGDLHLKLKGVKGATVLKCAKTEKAGNARGKIAQIETMEGAAFFATCEKYGVKAAQVRAISNYAAKQSEWEIEKALLKLRAIFRLL